MKAVLLGDAGYIHVQDWQAVLDRIVVEPRRMALIAHGCDVANLYRGGLSAFRPFARGR
jgi:hypothetical protein